MLEALRPRYPHVLERVDIDTGAELVRRYWDQIPVLVVQAREYAAPLNQATIERALKDAALRAPEADEATADQTAGHPNTPARHLGAMRPRLPWRRSRVR
jgi:hypothetical protein